MSEFKAEFYENGDEIPVKEFLDSLDDKMRAKFSMEIKLLEEKGNQLREPYSKPLGDGIFELRAKSRNRYFKSVIFLLLSRENNINTWIC